MRNFPMGQTGHNALKVSGSKAAEYQNTRKKYIQGLPS